MGNACNDPHVYKSIFELFLPRKSEFQPKTEAQSNADRNFKNVDLIFDLA